MEKAYRTPAYVPTETHSPYVNDLLKYRPNYIVRNGNFVFLTILLLLLFLSWLIKYPDILKAPVRLVAINAPKLVTAKVEGKLQKLLITTDQEVLQGQTLAFLQSTAKHEEVLSLRNWIYQVEPSIISNDLSILLTTPLPFWGDLGEMQIDFQDFQKTLHETLEVLASGYYQKKKANLQQDLAYLSTLGEKVKKRESITEQEYDLQLIDFKARQNLEKEKVIASLELNAEKSKLLNKEEALTSMSSQIVENNLSKHNKKKEILDLQKLMENQRFQFRSELLKLKSKVESWVQNYVITSPVSGKVLFVSFLQENQFIPLGEELFYIQPSNSHYYGELLAAQDGLGKIKVGQNVMIHLKSYPSNEFGYLKGNIEFISEIPTHKDSFLIKLGLQQSLETSHGKKILFRNSLAAEAQIITNEQRLIERFIAPLKNGGSH